MHFDFLRKRASDWVNLYWNKFYSYRPMLKEVKKSLESHIVLDCDTDVILTVLSQAEDVGLMDDYHSFIITSLVSHYYGLWPLSYGFKFYHWDTNFSSINIKVDYSLIWIYRNSYHGISTTVCVQLLLRFEFFFSYKKPNLIFPNISINGYICNRY